MGRYRRVGGSPTAPAPLEGDPATLSVSPRAPTRCACGGGCTLSASSAHTGDAAGGPPDRVPGESRELAVARRAALPGGSPSRRGWGGTAPDFGAICGSFGAALSVCGAVLRESGCVLLLWGPSVDARVAGSVPAVERWRSHGGVSWIKGAGGAGPDAALRAGAAASGSAGRGGFRGVRATAAARGALGSEGEDGNLPGRCGGAAGALPRCGHGVRHDRAGGDRPAGARCGCLLGSAAAGAVDGGLRDAVAVLYICEPDGP